MTFPGRVGAGMKSFFTPGALDPTGFRGTVQMLVLGLMMGEVCVYVMLKESARLGELPSYVPNALIVSVSSMEFLLGPLIGWFGSQRRRSIMVGWAVIALVGILPVFGVPMPETQADTALCNAPVTLPAGIPTLAAVRLSILIVAGVSCALARLAVTAHAIAYLDEYKPSHNLQLNIATLVLVRVVVLLVGATMLNTLLYIAPWAQFLIILIKLVIMIVKLLKCPVMPPILDPRHGRDRGFLRSVNRVLQSKMVILQILAMSLLAAALWGFGIHDTEFAHLKYQIVPDTSLLPKLGAPLHAMLVIFGVVLVGYMYTGPVMPVLDKKAAIRNAGRMIIYCVILLAVMTAALNCKKAEISGLGETTYTQPACGLLCGCDRPWTEFDPVCATEQMTTFYSPCHAGCASSATIGNYPVYTNCTCSPNGHVTIGACGDTSCAAAYSIHTLLFTGATLAGTLALVFQATVMLDAVDRRDKSVALGLASGTVSLFTFVGGHGLYGAIRAYSCALFLGDVCLIQNSTFVPRVGYTSIGLAGGSLIITIITFIIQHRQTKNKRTEVEDDDSVRL